MIFQETIKEVWKRTVKVGIAILFEFRILKIEEQKYSEIREQHFVNSDKNLIEKI